MYVSMYVGMYVCTTGTGKMEVRNLWDCSSRTKWDLAFEGQAIIQSIRTYINVYIYTYVMWIQNEGEVCRYIYMQYVHMYVCVWGEDVHMTMEYLMEKSSTYRGEIIMMMMMMMDTKQQGSPVVSQAGTITFRRRSNWLVLKGMITNINLDSRIWRQFQYPWGCLHTLQVCMYVLLYL